MVSQWKSWLVAGVVLLTVGAGCAGDMQVTPQPGGTDYQSPTTPPPAPGAPTSAGEPEEGIAGDVDQTVDAALAEVDRQSAVTSDEGADANVVDNDNADLNAFSQSYDKIDY